jgi:hypothetical protein
MTREGWNEYFLRPLELPRLGAQDSICRLSRGTAPPADPHVLHCGETVLDPFLGSGTTPWPPAAGPLFRGL